MTNNAVGDERRSRPTKTKTTTTTTMRLIRRTWWATFWAVSPLGISALLQGVTGKGVPPVRPSSSSSSSWIDAAKAALETNDVATAERSLMKAFAEVNGAVTNHPKLLDAFENLFRTKIRIAEQERNEKAEDDDDDDDDAARNAAVARDRMGLASLLTDQSRYQEAADELESAVRSLTTAVGTTTTSDDDDASCSSSLDKASSLLHRTRAMICDWRDHAASETRLAESTRRALAAGRLPAVHPFEALFWPRLSLEDATAVAHAYATRAIDAAAAAAGPTSSSSSSWTDLRERLPRVDPPFERVVRNDARVPNDGAPIRVGYLSPDFTGRHPLAFLTQDVFRLHDAKRFEVKLYSLGGPPDDSPEVRKILRGANGDWTTLSGSVAESAETVRADDLDVLVDLCGYTGTSSVAEVLARLRSTESDDPGRRRPVHVAYMGFPGSSGAPFVDYVVADAIVVPPEHRRWYTENVLFMPHCYFVNSHRHVAPSRDDDDDENDESDDDVRREDHGLPPRPAFVFCCHSRPDKIDPVTFRAWVRATRRTRERGSVIGRPDMASAVLWLLRGDGPSSRAEAHLRARARESWEDADDALVFCDHAPRPRHLARLSLADLFLDTPAYNAHTVGCDCLRAGVPLLTLSRRADDDDDEATIPTDKLASRVGSSLLRSSVSSSSSSSNDDLVDRLVASTMDEYETRMVECAEDETRAFATRLREDRSTAPLWDTERWVRNLETGLIAIVERARDGKEEADVYVVDDD